ncbi:MULTISPECIES: ankyrin repeat domain-containing protein [unclassified Corynebacterium]|uniref:ankyrin repeat domain-containing protein n=1 Tax=unclassified Corynebacterium TaxID=2624378 RepID=UPI0029CA05D4|nr:MULTISPECIES: ankyrin repeat domain-containing protein [unclassified Corynebacterium]WPF65585.1 ankyrin repeat domain-containing protein [Corynebacterium sp. 22KM0430]WPF68080.1 ankyrin repeat domain-containing protein [Corynebacterium sp. 21KM1197]
MTSANTPQTDESQPDLPQDVQELATRLFDMARKGDQQLVEYIDHGVAVDMVNQEGNSFLMLAAYAGHADLVAALVERGADVNKLNDRGQSPLAGAIFKKEDAVVEALIAAQADPHRGQPTAVETAQMFGREDLLERLR